MERKSQNSSSDKLDGIEALDCRMALLSLYLLSGHTLTEIANMMNTYPSTVHRKLEEHGISTRTQGPKRTDGQQITLEDLFKKQETPKHLDFSRAECFDAPMPCPMVTCRYNTYLDVDHNGNIKINYYHIGAAGQKVRPLEVWELTVPNCALHIADRVVVERWEEGGQLVENQVRTAPEEFISIDGELTLEFIGEAHFAGLTRERIRQIEAQALDKSKRKMKQTTKKKEPR